MLGDRFSIVREDLHRRYDLVCEPAEIDTVIDEEIARHEKTAKVKDFLPVLVERDASERLEELSGGERVDARPEVLFVDQRNTGRSQIASALLRHHNGEGILSRSVGLTPAGEGIDKRVLDVLRDRGIDTSSLYQKQLVARTVHRSSVIVLLGVEGHPDLPGDRYEHWDIADPEGATHEEVAAIVDDIDGRVRELIDILA
ncbi:low molecular weight phosphatase family protein [uncultured Corynebacterium sp.]|uniref:arsenate-mycothiol transferase ArsC n=1 Tax=uncultured Corynebacterium sp. TaxID=159447 RepID=UPI0025D4B97E|nr:low molecular weight phosphatase family protein [uncultured Corynebacterium sp.]